MDFDLLSRPWGKSNVEPIAKRMIVRSNTLAQMSLVYKFDKRLFSGPKLEKLQKEYALMVDF